MLITAAKVFFYNICFCYQFYSGPDQYNGKFRLLVLQKGRTLRPLVGTITVDSVIVSFEKLNCESTLPCSDSRYLRERRNPSINVT